MGKRARRILIDCSHVDFTRQPTGIPRVVLKYIEVGYEWGRRTGIEIIPVTPMQSGLYIRRPVPARHSKAVGGGRTGPCFGLLFSPYSASPAIFGSFTSSHDSDESVCSMAQ